MFSMAEKPLMLKDYLELDSHSESRIPFHCSTMRYFLDTELNQAKLSKSPISKFTALMQAPVLSLSRSFSKRLRRSIGRKSSAMADKKDNIKVKDIMKLSSFNNGDEGLSISPSPIVSSCSNSISSTSSTSSRRSSISRCSSSSGLEFLISSTATSVGAGEGDNNKDLEMKEMEREECNFHSEDESEKEQLSPVSVMDFPSYDQEEEEESTPHGFQQSLANIERTRHQLLEKIRRFECLAKLEPVDLDPLFEDEQNSGDDMPLDENVDDNEVIKKALELIKLLKGMSFTVVNENIEKLLLDFFIEGISSNNNSIITSNNQHVTAEKEQLLLNEGLHWLNQVDYSVQDDDLSVAYLKEMEKNGQWRCFKDDEPEVAMDLELEVMESLLDELVLDLLP